MSESTENILATIPTHSVRRYVFHGLCVAVVLIVCGFCAFIAWHLIKFHRHGEVSHRMQIAITRLAFHRPKELTDDQWAYCILSTWNLQIGYAHPSYIPTADMKRIVEELEAKIEAGPDLGTIDWFWDEYYRVYPSTQSNEWMRPTTLENRSQFEAGDHGGYPLSYWQAEYKALVSQ
jgi:hypothetical protein